MGGGVLALVVGITIFFALSIVLGIVNIYLAGHGNHGFTDIIEKYDHYISLSLADIILLKCRE